MQIIENKMQIESLNSIIPPYYFIYFCAASKFVYSNKPLFTFNIQNLKI